MQRRPKSKSTKKQPRVSPNPKKPSCSLCLKSNSTIAVSHSLYRKYSFSQNHYYFQKFNSIQLQATSAEKYEQSDEEEYIARYHKSASRRQLLSRLKEIYRLHRQIPRIFHSFIKQILSKCHHRKRLLQYFKIAKTLGIKVESVNFSSFLLSLSLPEQGKKTFKRMLVDTTESGQFQRDLLEEIGTNVC